VALLPAPAVWKLNLSLRKRLSIIGLLGLGIFATVCSANTTYDLWDLRNVTDLTWAMWDAVLWCTAELFVIVVAGSIPTLPPLWDFLFGAGRRERMLRKSRSTYGYGSSGKGWSKSGGSSGKYYKSSSSKDVGMDSLELSKVRPPSKAMVTVSGDEVPIWKDETGVGMQREDEDGIHVARSVRIEWEK
jgi:hypothetical protein